MAKQTLNTIKGWFRTALKPTQQQFWDTWDSFFHKDEKIPISNIEQLEQRFSEKADSELLTQHIADSHAHGLDNKVDKVAGKGLSTEDFTEALKTKLEGLEDFDPTDLYDQLEKLTPTVVEVENVDTYTLEWTDLLADRYGEYPTILVKQYTGVAWSHQPAPIDDIRDGSDQLTGFSIALGNIKSQIIIKK